MGWGIKVRETESEDRKQTISTLPIKTQRNDSGKLQDSSARYCGLTGIENGNPRSSEYLCASCYGNNGPLQLFGMGRTGGYLSLLSNHGPTGGPRPRLVCHTPRLTLRQICRLIRMTRQVRIKEATKASAARSRIQAPDLSTPVSPVAMTSEKHCLSSCFWRNRSANIKRVG
ncbi:UNVERIFIED_CONTAM: hypothetical protein FKN15_046964 [Acipenser sinensis]